MYKDLYKSAVDDIKINDELIKELAVKMNRKPVKNIRKYSVIAASLVILLLAAVFANNRSWFTSNGRITALNPGDTIKLSRVKGDIYINKIEGIRSSKLFIPEGAYSKDYTMEQLTEFFGRNPMPAVPEEFKPASETTNITFDPQGKMLFMSAISFSKDINDPEAPSIDIKLNKNTLPPKDCIYNSDSMKESVVGSTKVTAGMIKMEDKFDADGKPTAFYDVYSAEFIYNGIGYNITAKRIDPQTFIDILSSIIK